MERITPRLAKIVPALGVIILLDVSTASADSCGLEPPTVSITAPTMSVSVREGEVVNVVVEATSMGGCDFGVDHLSLRIDGAQGDIVDAPQSPGEFSAEFELNLVLGTHEVLAEAVDVYGQTGRSDALTIDVTAANSTTSDADTGTDPEGSGCQCRAAPHDWIAPMLIPWVVALGRRRGPQQRAPLRNRRFTPR